MKLKELLAAMPAWRNEERAPLSGLFELFTPLSINTIKDFQMKWDGTRPYEEFVIAQNKLIMECVELEKSNLGTLVRQYMELPPLTDETEIPEVVKGKTMPYAKGYEVMRALSVGYMQPTTEEVTEEIKNIKTEGDK